MATPFDYNDIRRIPLSTCDLKTPADMKKLATTMLQYMNTSFVSSDPILNSYISIEEIEGSGSPPGIPNKSSIVWDYASIPGYNAAIEQDLKHDTSGIPMWAVDSASGSSAYDDLPFINVGSHDIPDGGIFAVTGDQDIGGVHYFEGDRATNAFYQNAKINTTGATVTPGNTGVCNDRGMALVKVGSEPIFGRPCYVSVNSFEIQKDNGAFGQGNFICLGTVISGKVYVEKKPVAEVLSGYFSIGGPTTVTAGSNGKIPISSGSGFSFSGNVATALYPCVVFLMYRLDYVYNDTNGSASGSMSIRQNSSTVAGRGSASFNCFAQLVMTGPSSSATITDGRKSVTVFTTLNLNTGDTVDFYYENTGSKTFDIAGHVEGWVLGM